MEGESLTIIKNGIYRVSYVKPCTIDKNKKKAKIILEKPPKNIMDRLKSIGAEVFTELGVAKIVINGKKITVLENGEVTINNADDEKDIVRTMDLLMKALK